MESIILNILRQISFFQSLSESDQLSLIDNVKIEFFPENHVIFKEGDEADGMYIIRSGEVRIYRSRENDTEHTIAVLKENDFFGEMALISHEQRSASVRTLTETEVFIIQEKDLRELLEKKPEISQKISEGFVRRSKENSAE